MIPIPLRWLTAAASVLAALVGGVMFYFGAGLGLALWLASDPPDAAANLSAAEVTLVGLANLVSSFWVWRARLGAVVISGIASAALVIHVAVLNNLFGPLFWGHVVLLALLVLVASRLADMRAAQAGPPK